MTAKTNKIVFFNKLVLFNTNNELKKENLSIVDLFYDENISFYIIARYKTIIELKDKIPEEYKDRIFFAKRDHEVRSKVIELKESDIIFSIVGVVEYDAIFSFNCKIPLFYLDNLNVEPAEFDKKVIKYGLPIKSYQDIIDCLKAQEINKNRYFQIDDNESFNVLSLNNANTYYRPEDEVRIKKIFEANLKSNERTRDQRILLLLFFDFLNEISQSKYFEQINFWGTFPSSNPDNKNTSVSFIKEAVRVLVNGKPQNDQEILIRHKGMHPKNKSGAMRIGYKCDKDFDTLIVNPRLKGKLKNEVVCIIDDYITNGYSAEAAKHLLFAAGVKKVIFVSFGKFGRKYHSTKYKINGNVFSGEYEYNFNSETVNTDQSNYDLNSDYQILSFDKLI